MFCSSCGTLRCIPYQHREAPNAPEAQVDTMATWWWLSPFSKASSPIQHLYTHTKASWYYCWSKLSVLKCLSEVKLYWVIYNRLVKKIGSVKKKSFKVALENEIRKTHKYTTRNMLCYYCRGRRKMKTPFGNSLWSTYVLLPSLDSLHKILWSSQDITLLECSNLPFNFQPPCCLFPGDIFVLVLVFESPAKKYFSSLCGGFAVQ